MDTHRLQTGSWSGWDAVRHWMYEDIYAALDRVTFPQDVSMFEIGARGTDTPIGRMMTQLQGLKQFSLIMACGELPEYDFLKLPLFNNALDLFVADQVLEHVTKPWVAVEEMKRIVRPGGLVVCASPFMFPMHYCPVDCWRIGRNGYQVLFPPDEFEELTCKSWGTGKIVAWANAHPDLRGFYGNYISVAEAKVMMPEFDQPHYDADHPVVVWYVGRKK